jgi:hypothetical protein
VICGYSEYLVDRKIPKELKSSLNTVPISSSECERHFSEEPQSDPIRIFFVD